MVLAHLYLHCKHTQGEKCTAAAVNHIAAPENNIGGRQFTHCIYLTCVGRGKGSSSSSSSALLTCGGSGVSAACSLKSRPFVPRVLCASTFAPPFLLLCCCYFTSIFVAPLPFYHSAAIQVRHTARQRARPSE